MARATAASEAMAVSEFYNRKHEEEKFDSIKLNAPKCVHMMVGPRSGGKSSSARHMLRKYNLDGLCYLNCRTMEVTTPDRFALAVLEFGLASLMKNEDIVNIAASISRNSHQQTAADNAIVALTGIRAKLHMTLWGPRFGFDLGSSAKLLLSKLKEERNGKMWLQDMAYVIKRFAEAWSVARKQGKVKGWPCIMVDEADLLLACRDNNFPEFTHLMAYFIALTKELGLCHVFLLTSDFSFLERTRDVLPADFRRTVVHGDFTQQQAQGFMELCLKHCAHQWQATWQEDWPRVYKVCGSNAGALEAAASLFQMYGNWEEALVAACEDIFLKVEEAAESGGPGYTAEQFGAVALQLVQKVDHSSCNPGNTNTPVTPTLVARDVWKLLGNGKADIVKKVLDAMVQDNAFSVRPPSDWALDIPYQRKLVLTAPSPRHLHCMIELRDQLKAVEPKEAAAAGPRGFASQEVQDAQGAGGMAGLSPA